MLKVRVKTHFLQMLKKEKDYKNPFASYIFRATNQLNLLQ